MLRRRYALGAKQLPKIPNSREGSLYNGNGLRVLEVERIGEKDQSPFSLLLEIESRLRTEGRNDRIEQRKRSKEKERLSDNNLSRYCE